MTWKELEKFIKSLSKSQRDKEVVIYIPSLLDFTTISRAVNTSKVYLNLKCDSDSFIEINA